jgi:hypothetical protein
LWNPVQCPLFRCNASYLRARRYVGKLFVGIQPEAKRMTKRVPISVSPGGVIGYDVEGCVDRDVYNYFYLITRTKEEHYGTMGL